MKGQDESRICRSRRSLVGLCFQKIAPDCHRIHTCCTRFFDTQISQRRVISVQLCRTRLAPRNWRGTESKSLVKTDLSVHIGLPSPSEATSHNQRRLTSNGYCLVTSSGTCTVFNRTLPSSVPYTGSLIILWPVRPRFYY